MSLKNIRIADLEIFITAAHMKSLGKSALRHHLSQSAASTAVQRVEIAFGIPLCTHEKKRFALSQEGQLLLPKIEAWVNQLKNIIGSKGQNPLRLATTHALAQIALPAALSLGAVTFQHMRPDAAYAALLRGEVDLAIVPDNALWANVFATEIARGEFRLYSRQEKALPQPVVLPEDQMEVIALQHTWEKIHGEPLPIKTRIPSWSLIANICRASDEVGFLPEFLAEQFDLHPVDWQPKGALYRILALSRTGNKDVEPFIKRLQEAFIPHSIEATY